MGYKTKKMSQVSLIPELLYLTGSYAYCMLMIVFGLTRKGNILMR